MTLTELQALIDQQFELEAEDCDRCPEELIPAIPGFVACFHIGAEEDASPYSAGSALQMAGLINEGRSLYSIHDSNWPELLFLFDRDAVHHLTPEQFRRSQA